MYLHKSQFATVPLIPRVESDTKDIRVRSWDDTDGWTVREICTTHQVERVKPLTRAAPTTTPSGTAGTTTAQVLAAMATAALAQTITQTHLKTATAQTLGDSLLQEDNHQEIQPQQEILTLIKPLTQ